MRVYQITAHHYCAGILVEPRKNIVVSAAPIIKWMLGRNLATVVTYCRTKGYEINEVTEARAEELELANE